MVKFIDMSRAAQSEMNVEIEVDGEWAPITRQVTGFAEAELHGEKRWIQTNNSPMRPASEDEVLPSVSPTILENPVKFIDSPVKRIEKTAKRVAYPRAKRKKGKIPQFFAKREVEQFFTPDPPDAYIAWKERRGHLFWGAKLTFVRRKIELYAVPEAVLEEEEEKPQAIPFAQPAYEATMELFGFLSDKVEKDYRRQPFAATPGLDRQKSRPATKPKPLKPLEFQRLTEFGQDYRRVSQRIFCTPFDAAYWSSIVGTPPLDAGPTAPAETPALPDLVLNEMTDDFSWKPAPPLTRPPTLAASPLPPKPKQKKKKKKAKKQLKKPSPPPLKQLLRKTRPGKASKPRPKLEGTPSKVMVKKAFIPPPPPVHE